MLFRQIALLSLFLAVTLSANSALKESQKLSTTTNTVLQKTQTKIDLLDDERHMMLAEYDIVSQELENYKTYNSQLQDIIDSQLSEIASIDAQSDEIEVTKRGIMPFMQRMIDTLEQFIRNDRPFLPDERTARIVSLRESMKRADLSIAAKYRQILEAYQIEIDYGNTIEAYNGDIEGRQVSFLKVGRIGLFYQARDGHRSAVWSKQDKRWQTLEGSDYHIAIAKGIKMARKQRSPELFFIAVDQEEVRR